MKRDQWSSNFGFLMAAAGSAVGLGNLWKFPYIVGMNGGGVFLIIYLFLLILLGTPILLTEMAIGRSSRLNAIDACKAIAPKWGFVGGMGVIGAFFILCYYSVIGGWVLKYFFKYIISPEIKEPEQYFQSFTSSTAEPIAWHVIFAAIVVFIVIRGISGGIEKVSKIFLPLLAAFIILIAVNGMILPGSVEGVKFILKPDFSHIKSVGDFFGIVLSAMGQVFFSLSLGMGTLITYGSYLNKDSNLMTNAIYIPFFDLIIALAACFAIMPAVYAFGLEPSTGSGLIFKTLPHVFANMKFGRILAVIFFLLVLFAAITSAISLLEVIASYLIDSMNWHRITASIVPAAAFTAIGCLASLSFGKLSHIKIFGSSIFDFLSEFPDKILMPIGGFFLCILAGYIWGMPNFEKEVTSGGKYTFHFKRLTEFIIKIFAPLMIIIIFIASFI